MVVGITGKSGSGKSTYGKQLAEKLGGIYLDVDKLCHLEMDVIHNDACKILGLSLTASSKDMGEILFSNREKYNEITNIIWPLVEKKILDTIDNNMVTIVDHILLPHMDNIWPKCTFKYLIYCEDSIRFERIIKRDNISKEYLEKREKASIDYSSYKFDKVIETS